MVKNLPATQETWVRSWIGNIPWGREQQTTPALLPGEFHGQRSLVGYNPWGCKESDTTERLHFHFHDQTINKYCVMLCGLPVTFPNLISFNPPNSQLRHCYVSPQIHMLKPHPQHLRMWLHLKRGSLKR